MDNDKTHSKRRDCFACTSAQADNGPPTLNISVFHPVGGAALHVLVCRLNYSVDSRHSQAGNGSPTLKISVFHRSIS
jgi:hypothetical protein